MIDPDNIPHFFLSIYIREREAKNVSQTNISASKKKKKGASIYVGDPRYVG